MSSLKTSLKTAAAIGRTDTKSENETEGDDLTCVVCHDVFCVPVTTHCQHTFCQGCLEEIYDRTNVFAATRNVSCPICRAVFMLPPLASKNILIEKLAVKHLGAKEYARRQSQWNQRKWLMLQKREDMYRRRGVGDGRLSTTVPAPINEPHFEPIFASPVHVPAGTPMIVLANHGHNAPQTNPSFVEQLQKRHLVLLLLTAAVLLLILTSS
jgi:hypothetical protein